jgi:hypothetical protein
MKQFKTFPSVLVIIISIILVRTSHLSAAETFCDYFNGDGLDLTEFNTFHVSWSADSVPWYRDLESNKLPIDEFRLPIFTPAFAGVTSSLQKQESQIENRKFQIDNEPLTPPINFRASTWDIITPYYCEIRTHSGRPLQWDSDIQPASNPADDIVCCYDADFIHAMRIPAPTSVVLVAIGLLSLRFIRRLRY